MKAAARSFLGRRGGAQVAVRLAGRWQRLRDGGLNTKERWSKRTGHESSYWSDALKAPGAREQYADRLDPHAEVRTPVLRQAIDEIKAAEVTILDVGAGPLTSVGKTYPGKKLKIVPTDALADDYDRSLREADIEPPVRTIACRGEEVAERFGEGSFDVSFMANALEHTADPLLVLDNLVKVLKPDGRVALNHMRNEGERNGYFGIHLWNIDERDGRFVVWNQSETHDVNEWLGERCEVTCWTDEKERINCLLHRR
jgi:2-polyprenyl-3-methyl-5-hydroxy-6-metoxy-1,4-benzoquinol methylase